MIREVKVIQCTCERCGKEFIPRTCPSCKSPNWNKQTTKPGRPRKVKVIGEEIPPEPELTADDVPIESQSPAKVTPIVKERTRTELPKPKRKEKKVKATGKSGLCPHKFIRLDDGTTACPTCKNGG